MAEGSSSDKKPASSSNRGIRTLADLNRTASDSDRPLEYYTGGEKSGMLVQDPDKKNSDVDDLFERARQHGATEETPPEENPSLISRAFTGVARLLTGGSVAPQPPQAAVHTVTFWRNGFTVDDGPLRSLDDPENQSFLNSIRMNDVPPELRPADRRTEVDLRLVRRDEDCPVGIPPVRAFQGTGRTLGSSSSSAAEEPSSSSTASVAINSSTGGFSVDESKPVTSIQIRLSDGTRMVARFNHHHTVADIRGFINYSRRGTAPNYQLQVMGFPPRMLNDPEETIEKAGLMNSVVIQKL